MHMKSATGRLKDSSLVKSVNTLFNLSDTKLAGLKFPLPSLLRKSRFVTGSMIVIVAVLLFSFHPFSSSISDIPVYKVKKSNFVVSITESGEIRAKNATSVVTPRVSGNLKIVFLVPEGTYVHAGEVVVRFDPTEAMNNLKNAQSQLEIAQSDKEKLLADQRSQLTNLESALKEAQLSYELSKLNLEQMKFEAEIKQQQSKLELERNELNLKKAQQAVESQKIIQKSELDKTEIQLQQAKATLEKAKRDLDALTLKAPKEGLVVYETNWSTGRKMMVGDTPWPGMPLISLPDLSQMQSATYVNEVDVSKVRKGQKVLVRLDAFQDSTFTGVISSVAALGRAKDRNSTIKVFEVEVDVLSQSPILKPGMTTSNKIIVDQVPNVIYVPQEAVFDKGGKKVVYVKDGSSFDTRQVQTGEKSEDYVVITKGLKQNEEVALIDPTLKTLGAPNQDGGSKAVANPSQVN